MEIGKDDFDGDGRDLYLNNLQEYYKNLIKNKRMIDKLLELVENIAYSAYSGFEADTDEILITTSPYLMEMDINKFSSLYYVLEGNRRLFSLFLLLDLYNSRQELKKTISNSQYDKFQKIFNNSEFKDKEIECKVFNVKEKGETYTWKILNSRHFGNRKGKLNWPRGVVLNIIFTTINDFRDSLHKTEGEALNSNQYNDMIKNVESYTGKKN